MASFAYGATLFQRDHGGSMRFRLEADEAELSEKGERFVAELAKSLFPACPELSELLEKALPAKDPELRYPVLRELKALMHGEYTATLERMRHDVECVLSQSDSEAQKSEVPIADSDLITYRRVRQLLLRRGYEEKDFDPGGSLAGLSASELLDRARDANS